MTSLKTIIEAFDSNSDTSQWDSQSDEDCLLSDTESLESSSSSSSDVDQPKRKLHRIMNFMENITIMYDDQEFKEHFRLKRSSCENIIRLIASHNVLPNHRFGREKISCEKAVYMTVWYLSNLETFRQISDRFNVTKSSAYRIINKVITFLVKVAKKYISWPSDQRKESIKAEFQKLKGINGVIGCIDGTHINIKRPSKHADQYCNRKGDHSILLQSVCDNKKRFIDVFCGEAGSMHDSRLLRKSSLYRKGMGGLLGDDFLLGDSAYPCLNWLIPPFKDNGNLTQNQIIFNYRHSSTRIIIENAYGLLKGRFRRLRMFDNNNIIFIVRCVVAACVLHNMCIDNDDVLLEGENNMQLENLPSEEFHAVLQQQQQRRNELFRDMFPE